MANCIIASIDVTVTRTEKERDDSQPNNLRAKTNSDNSAGVLLSTRQRTASPGYVIQCVYSQKMDNAIEHPTNFFS
jgi:hypothetical protein